MKHCLRALAAFVFLLALGASAAHAQDLARAETLVAEGRFTDARGIVNAWLEKNPQGSERARALLLRGELTSDASKAEVDYLTITLEHPTSAQAPEALLRLGQQYMTAGDAARAATYLRRLVSDYPAAPQKELGREWLARAGTPAPPKATPAKQAPATAAHYALQSGAFRDPRGARSLASQLTRAGFEARVVTLGAGGLNLVRVGRYATSGDAVEVARKVRAKGFTAVVVDDAAREKPVGG